MIDFRKRCQTFSLLVLGSVLARAASAQYTITTIAGNLPPNGVASASVGLSYVYGVAVDTAGNVYVAAQQQNRIYKAAVDGTLTTVAGTGTFGFSGDNGPAASAQLSGPSGVAVDSAGNLYIADTNSARIRKVSGGMITTVAGSGIFGFSGDNGSATLAQISGPTGVAVDGSGRLYIADSNNHRVRKVENGVITTVAGNGTGGFSGDNSQATSAQLDFPWGVAVDNSGNLFIADRFNYRVRKVAAGVITTVAGNGVPGFSGDNGLAVIAQLNSPAGLAVDAAGNLYIADAGNGRIRKVAGGVITTLAGGSGGCAQQTDPVGDGCPAANALLSSPYGVALDSAGNPYIADTFNYRIRKIAGGVISTIAGNGSYQYSGDNGLAASAQFSPQGVAVRSPGNFYIADGPDYRIRSVSGGLITTAAGNGVCCYNGDNIPATSAQLNPAGVAVDSAGNLYTAEGFAGFPFSGFGSSNRVRKVSGGVISAFAGNGQFGYSGDNGPATSASLSSPRAVAVDGSGNVYIADQSNNRVRKVSGGVITTVAGGGPRDGAAATSISLSFPVGVAVDAAGNLYFPSSGDNRVYKVAPSGTITTVAGNGSSGFSGDNGPATAAQLNSPYGVAVNSAGTVVFIADRFNNRVRMVSGGVITTVAGGGGGCAQQTDPVGDGCPGASASLNAPAVVAMDTAGVNLYIADALNYRVRKLAGGVITTVAGNGTCCYSGDNGPATAAQLNYATGIAVDNNTGDLYIGDSESFRVRKVSGGVITTVAGTGAFGYSGDNGPATSAQLSYSYGVAVDNAGSLYIADAANHRIRKVTGGVITTVAGTGIGDYSGDNGPATSAQINYPYEIALDGAGNLYIADTNNYRVRKVSGGNITTVAGNGLFSFSGDGGPAASAQLNSPSAVAVDGAGTLYIADANNFRIRQVSAGGVITTVAGNGSFGYSGENVPATGAIGNSPAIAADSAGNLYLADQSYSLIRKVSGGLIATIAGNFSSGYSGDGGPATSAALSNPQGLAVDIAGNVYIADTGNSRIRLLTLNPKTITVITPLSVIAGAPGFTLHVNGSGFINGDIVQWNGTALATTFVNSGQLTAPVSSVQVAQIGTAAVTVNGLSNAVGFAILVPRQSGDFDGSGTPDLVWQNDTTRQVTVHYYGGAQGAVYQSFNWLNIGGVPGWRVVGTGDFDGNGVPDLVWMNDATRQVTVNYYGGAGGATFIGWSFLNASGVPGWSVVAVADVDGNGIPDLIWQNDTTRQVTVHYYGGAGGAVYQSFNWLNIGGVPGWRVAGAADFDGNGTPDLVWQNDVTRQVTVHYYGGAQGAVYQSFNWLNIGGVPGWSVAGMADFDHNGVPDLVWQNDTTRQVTVHYYGGAQGAVYQSFNWLNISGVPGWRVIVPR